MLKMDVKIMKNFVWNCALNIAYLMQNLWDVSCSTLVVDTVEFCLFSFVDKFKVLCQKVKIFRNELGIVGMCVAKPMTHGISWEIKQMICAIWAHDMKPQNYILFSIVAIFWSTCFWLKCVVHAAVSLLLWMWPCCQCL